MKVTQVPGAFYISTVADHFKIKNLLLNSIEKAGTYSFINSNQKIFNTDWHLSSRFSRPYWEIFYPYCVDHLKEISNECDFTSIEVANYWFQQYKHGDFHCWHVHNDCTFSSVYFLELPTKNLSTSFKLNKTEFQVDVEEGQILTFPSSYVHKSKKNLTNKVKTIISFNSLITDCINFSDNQ